jgi:hypothetical protein
MNAFVVNECPICMDPIETQRNCVTTECGHCFHTNCLMTSVAHNGFGCPYCRTKMAEEVADEDSEYDDEEEDYEDELYSDYALRGLRFFNNNINGDENDEEDLEEETEDEEDAEEENAEEEEEAPKPTPSYIAQKLVEQGISMEDMVKLLLVNLNEYEREFDDFDRVENEMFGRVKSIMNNYNPPVQNV